MNVPRPGGENRRWRPAVPGVAVLRGYRRRWLRGDLVAGVTVAAYLVPQVMAYAGVAGLPPVAGLWAALPFAQRTDVVDANQELRIAGQSR
ncbi:MAG TPA: SulP family inorganic anion transporter [Streptosporangiaceae bacterium]